MFDRPDSRGRVRRRLAWLVVSAALLAGAAPADAAQLPHARATPARSDSAADTTRGSEATAPGSPRAALAAFFDAANQRDWTKAATWLDLPDSLQSDGPRLARELKVVLDHYVWVDMDEVSGEPAGDTTDGLSRNVEQVALIPGPNDTREPVRLVRTTRAGTTRWLVSRATVERIPRWYGALPDRWTLEHLPPALLRTGPLGILWWQWLALPLLVALAWGLGAVIGRLARFILERVVRRTAAEWDDDLVSRLAGPLTLLSGLLVAEVLLPFLSLDALARARIGRLVNALFLLAVFWALWRLVDVARSVVAHTRWALQSTASRSLLPLAARVTKVAVLAVGAVAVLSLLGYPVASLVAGLGLGGLAFALAAQKTVENLFGAFSLGVDQPFREGDFVKIEDFVGTVEAIGLRSTRVRTLDRTIITLPNGKLADSRIESFAVRDRIRLACVIGLVYETTAAQMRAVLEGFERTLREHPKIWPDSMTIRFMQFGASSLDIQIMAWFRTSDWNEFQLIRQEVLLSFMEVVEQAGSSFAFPTQTLHVASLPPMPAPAGGDGSGAPAAQPPAGAGG